MKKDLKVKIFFIIFYIVGLVGIFIPLTTHFFVGLTPFALFLSFIFLMIFHKRFDLKTIVIFSSIYLLGFIIEVIGVNTGLIFGNYNYGNALGPKIFNTPLIIGLNWILLVYLTSSVFEKTKLHIWLKVIFASVLMLLYDIILEHVAPKMDMWNWTEKNVPLKNYLAWFIIALIFHTMIKSGKIKTTNKLSLTLLGCQFVFFIVLLFK